MAIQPIDTVYQTEGPDCHASLAMTKFAVLLVIFTFGPIHFAMAAAEEVPSSAATAEDHSSGFTCRRDDECILTTGLCGYDMAINRLHASEAEEEIADMRASEACLKTGSHNPKAIAKCISQKCMVAYP